MLNTKRSLGLLFLGCGWATRIHSRTLKRIRAVDLFYASRASTRAQTLCARFGGRRAYDSYEQALADDAIDVALVATPTSTHKELAMLALRAGKHVIVEKPAFMTSAELDVVRNAAHRERRELFAAENYYYKPIVEHLRRSISRGDLGDVRFVSLNATKRQSSRDWRGDPTLSGGGALFEAGVHWVNLASNIGLEVEEVHAYRVGDGHLPDRSSLVVFRYTNGAIGTLAHSWELAAPLGGLRLSKVQGTSGAVTFESNGFAYVQSGRRPSVGFPLLGDPLGYRTMFRDFFGALRDGRPPRFTLELARRDLAFLEQAEASLAANCESPESAGSEVA